MSKDDRPSAEALAATVADTLRANPEAEKMFRANPAKFLEVTLGHPLPADLRIEIHDNTDTVWHIPVGQPPGPIGDADLESVAGGWGGDVFYAISPAGRAQAQRQFQKDMADPEKRAALNAKIQAALNRG